MGKWSSLIRDVAGKKRFSTAVILAAGSGTRFGSGAAKQFIKLRGVPTLVWSALAFEKSPLIDEMVVVARPGDEDLCRRLLRDAGIVKVTRVVAGGETRQQSALRGLEAANPKTDYIALHDAARCLVTPDMIEAVFEAAFVTGAAAAASPVTDTLKRTDLTGTVKETVDRKDMWAAATPQVFRADLYRAASYLAEKDGFVGTDDCALAERVGYPPKMVDCGRTNIKITYPEDAVMAEALLAERMES